MEQEQRCRRKARRACCCITFLLLVNMLMLLWISSRTSFVSWWLLNPDNQMIVELDDNTFCNDICANMICGDEYPCDITTCQSQCNVSLNSKMSMYNKFDSSSSESSEEEYNDEDRAYIAKGTDNDRQYHRRHHRHGRHHHRSGDRKRHHMHMHGFKHKFGFK
eukprot:64036_1